MDPLLLLRDLIARTQSHALAELPPETPNVLSPHIDERHPIEENIDSRIQVFLFAETGLLLQDGTFIKVDSVPTIHYPMRAVSSVVRTRILSDLIGMCLLRLQARAVRARCSGQFSYCFHHDSEPSTGAAAASSWHQFHSISPVLLSSIKLHILRCICSMSSTEPLENNTRVIKLSCFSLAFVPVRPLDVTLFAAQDAAVPKGRSIWQHGSLQSSSSSLSLSACEPCSPPSVSPAQSWWMLGFSSAQRARYSSLSHDSHDLKKKTAIVGVLTCKRCQKPRIVFHPAYAGIKGEWRLFQATFGKASWLRDYICGYQVNAQSDAGDEVSEILIEPCDRSQLGMHMSSPCDANVSSFFYSTVTKVKGKNHPDIELRMQQFVDNALDVCAVCATRGEDCKLCFAKKYFPLSAYPKTKVSLCNTCRNIYCGDKLPDHGVVIEVDVPADQHDMLMHKKRETGDRSVVHHAVRLAKKRRSELQPWIFEDGDFPLRSDMRTICVLQAAPVNETAVDAVVAEKSPGLMSHVAQQISVPNSTPSGRHSEDVLRDGISTSAAGHCFRDGFSPSQTYVWKNFMAADSSRQLDCCVGALRCKECLKPRLIIGQFPRGRPTQGSLGAVFPREATVGYHCGLQLNQQALPTELQHFVMEPCDAQPWSLPHAQNCCEVLVHHFVYSLNSKLTDRLISLLPNAADDLAICAQCAGKEHLHSYTAAEVFGRDRGRNNQFLLLCDNCVALLMIAP
jgi:hypothetical protein